MISLDINKSNIIDARDKHVKFLTPKILKKVSNSNDKKIKDFLVENRVKQILESKPKKLYNLNLLFLKEIIPNFEPIDWLDYLNINNIENAEKKEELKKNLKIISNYNKKIVSIFRYDLFIVKKKEYCAYHLAENLDIPTCPYCGRMYTKTVSKKSKITRPQFDHWFSKSQYPLLALSFYNLIPSCHICNSDVKGAEPFLLESHFHPYHKVDNFKYTFSYDLEAYDKACIKIKAEEGISKNSVKAFELEEIYKAHNDELADLLKIKQAYSERYIDILNGLLGNDITLSKEEIYRLAFGAYIDDDNFDRRPLSKMKKDILTELGII